MPDSLGASQLGINVRERTAVAKELAEKVFQPDAEIDKAQQNELGSFRGQRDIRAWLAILTFLAVIFALRYAQDLFVPIVVAVLIAYALDPLVTVVTRLRIPRVVAAAIVLFGLLGAVGGGAYALRHQANAVLESLPAAAQRLQQRIRDLRHATTQSTGALDTIQRAAKEIEKTATEAAGGSKAATGVTTVQVDEPVFRANAYLWYGSVGLLGLLGQMVMAGFLLFFLLASGDLFKRKLVRVIGTKLSEKRITVDVINDINGQIERFLLIQIFTSLVVGVCTTGALWAFGFNQPAVWGLAAGILNSVPYFGPIIVTAGLALVAFLQFGSLPGTLRVAGAALLITSLEGFLLTPWLMGRAARINGVAMFLSLLFWSWLWGIIGMIVAVPVMMAIKSICERIDDLQALGELLGERE
jgi:predicted PurR-regulated permease PerM